MLIAKLWDGLLGVYFVKFNSCWRRVRSGMMVQGPTKRGARDVDSVFERVQRFGAHQGRAEPSQPPYLSSRGAFAGSSRTLDGEPRQSEQPVSTVSLGRPTTRALAEAVFHTITFWRNGFTVNDGTLRRLDDPANESFLDVSGCLLLFCTECFYLAMLVLVGSNWSRPISRSNTSN